MLYTIRNITNNGSSSLLEFTDYKPITLDTEFVEEKDLKPGRYIWIDDEDEITKGIKVACSAIIRIKDGKRYLFAAQRGYGQFAGGWEFPGGKLEPGEDSKEAIKREIQEELSANIEVLKFIDTSEYDYDTFHVSMDCFLCKLCSKLNLNEHSDAKWLSKEKLYSVDWLPADLPLVKKIEHYL